MISSKHIKLRIIFMGTSTFARNILQAIIDAGYNVVSVYTQPDRKADRKQTVKKGEVKLIAEQYNIPIFEPVKLDEGAIRDIKEQKPDLIIIASYGKILPKILLEIPGFGCINIHASMLPELRGPSPVQNAILRGKKETGVTIMLMDEGIDTGDILSQEKVEIEKDETAPKLLDKLSRVGSEILINTVPLWFQLQITPRKQDGEKASLCQLIERSDGKIIWADEAESIYNCYRAFQPWPGIFTFIEKDGYFRRIKLHKISRLKNDQESVRRAGEVFQIEDKIGVQAGKGSVILEEVQLEGKERMGIDEFIRGCPELIGNILK